MHCSSYASNLDKYIPFTPSAGNYSIDDFNAKAKVAVLQQRQNWEVRKIRDLRLVMQENYTFIACNSFSIAFGISGKHLKNIT